MYHQVFITDFFSHFIIASNFDVQTLGSFPQFVSLIVLKLFFISSYMHYYNSPQANFASPSGKSSVIASSMIGDHILPQHTNLTLLCPFLTFILTLSLRPPL